MARITVEDCLDKVDNRFQLVMISSKRARQLQVEGKEPMLPVDKDKPTVIALREIADGLVDAEILKEKPPVESDEIEGEGEAKLETPSEDDLAVAQEMQAVADEELEQKAEQEDEEEPPEQV